MALIKCIECDKELSDKAEVCPHCGIPRKPVTVKVHQETGASGSMGCLYLAAALLFLVLLSQCIGEDDKPLEQATVIEPKVPLSRAGAGWMVLGSQGSTVFVYVDPAAERNQDVYRDASVEICGMLSCKALFWSDKAMVPTALPMTDAQVDSQIAQWTYNANNGHRSLSWSCKSGIEAADCF